MCFEEESFTNYKIYNNLQLVYLNDNFTYRIPRQGNATITLISGIEKKNPWCSYALD
jgi:hypothetical protein